MNQIQFSLQSMEAKRNWYKGTAGAQERAGTRDSQFTTVREGSYEILSC